MITSNCTGGILYHWLGMKFNSPFINLWISNADFIKLLENFDVFMATPLKEIKIEGINYPVGEGWGKIKVYFMHYNSFEEANNKWNERQQRINKDNLFVMFTNFNGDEELLRRFDNLPFENKVVFTGKNFDYPSSFCLKGFEDNDGAVGQIYYIENIVGKRYIEQFDLHSFFDNKC